MSSLFSVVPLHSSCPAQPPRCPWHETNSLATFRQMVIQSGILANSLRARSRRSILLRKIFKSMSSTKALWYVDEDCNDFLPWLERKAGAKICSTLSIGKSPHGGRGLYASENIKKGDILWNIPFSVQLAQENLPPEISISLGNYLDPVTKVAVLILHEKKLGQDSEWAPYISCLPLPHDMHNSVFWSDEELEMIRPSSLYEETLRNKELIEGDFKTVKNSVFDRFPSCFQDPTLEEFTHAYHLVKSRGWNTKKRGVSLIPFADFMNHSNTSETTVTNNEEQQISKIIADRDFAAGEEIVIKYGKYANATLLSSYGFTLPHNTFDFDIVKLSSIAEDHNQLCSRSQIMLGFSPFWNGVEINEVQSVEDIPTALRAFARILVSGSEQGTQASWYPLKDKLREIEAHMFLHDKLSKLIGNRDEHIDKLVVGKRGVRKQLAVDLLRGENRILKLACAYLERYCSKLKVKC